MPTDLRMNTRVPTLKLQKTNAIIVNRQLTVTAGTAVSGIYMVLVDSS
jgi:hypothetical protein